MAKDDKTNVYSALEVAKICGVVNQTAINWIRNGYLKAFTTPGGQYRVYLDDLIDFMNQRKMRIPQDLLDLSLGSKTFSILIVDDDRVLNTILARFIERNVENATIYQAFDGFEAGSQLTDKKPDLVLLDLDLPGIDGFSLCSKISSSDTFGNPTIFIITGLNEEGIEERLKSMGASEFFQKPLNMVEIAESINRIKDSK